MPTKATAHAAVAPPKRRTSKRRITPELGEMVELMYPQATGQAIADALGLTDKSVYHWVGRRGIRKGIVSRAKPMGSERVTHGNYLVRKCTNDPDMNKRFLYAHVLAWEEHNGRKKPLDHVVVFVDGDKRNFRPENLYCLPKSELLKWMRFVSAPYEIHADRLIRRIMTLETSDAVKRKLLEQVEKLLDPDQKVDLHRARMVCETVQTAVNVMKVEIEYLRAIEGDGKIPFLETPHTAKARLKKLPRDPLLNGPAEDHPWRGLGSRKAN